MYRKILKIFCVSFKCFIRIFIKLMHKNVMSSHLNMYANAFELKYFTSLFFCFRFSRLVYYRIFYLYFHVILFDIKDFCI